MTLQAFIISFQDKQLRSIHLKPCSPNRKLSPPPPPMASPMDPRVVGARPYPSSTGQNKICDIVKLPKSSDINLNAASIYRIRISGRAVIRQPSSPRNSLCESPKFCHNVKVEPVGSPTTSLFDSLTGEAQQVPSPQHLALTGTALFHYCAIDNETLEVGIGRILFVDST